MFVAWERVFSFSPCGDNSCYNSGSVVWQGDYVIFLLSHKKPMGLGIINYINAFLFLGKWEFIVNEVV